MTDNYQNEYYPRMETERAQGLLEHYRLDCLKITVDCLTDEAKTIIGAGALDCLFDSVNSFLMIPLESITFTMRDKGEQHIMLTTNYTLVIRMHNPGEAEEYVECSVA